MIVPASRPVGRGSPSLILPLRPRVFLRTPLVTSRSSDIPARSARFWIGPGSSLMKGALTSLRPRRGTFCRRPAHVSGRGSQPFAPWRLSGADRTSCRRAFRRSPERLPRKLQISDDNRRSAIVAGRAPKRAVRATAASGVMQRWPATKSIGTFSRPSARNAGFQRTRT